MLLDFLGSINWVDILAFLVFLRVAHMAYRKGFFVEIFKFLGTACATYLSLHYFTILSDLFRGSSPGLESAPLDFMDFIGFVLLTIVGYAIFLVARMAFTKFAPDPEEIARFSRYSALALGMMRGLLITGLVVFGMAISTMEYFSDMAAESLTGRVMFYVPVILYRDTWKMIDSAGGNEGYNDEIDRIEQRYEELVYELDARRNADDGEI